MAKDEKIATDKEYKRLEEIAKELEKMGFIHEAGIVLRKQQHLRRRVEATKK